MEEYTIDGLTYNDKVPHSRAERTLYEILYKNKKGSNSGEHNDPGSDPNNNSNTP